MKSMVICCLFSTLFGQILGGACRAIGLTGGIATGKSGASKIFRENKIPVIDADQIAKAVVEPGHRAYNNVIAHFGKQILQQDGSIDRKKLGEIVFNNPKERKALNKCTHGSILFEIFVQLMKYRLFQRKRMVILDAPLLYETGILQYFCYPIVVVACPPSTQLDRLMKRDNLKEGEATARIEAQMPLEEKVKRCDIVIDNSGSLEQLRQRSMDALRTAANLLDRKVIKEEPQRTTL